MIYFLSRPLILQSKVVYLVSFIMQYVSLNKRCPPQDHVSFSIFGPELMAMFFNVDCLASTSSLEAVSFWVYATYTVEQSSVSYST